MKIPLVGDVKPIWLATAGIIFGGGFLYWRKKQAASAAANAAAAATSTDQDPNAIDPNTGMTYAEEGSDVYGATSAYGGIDPASGIPYIDEGSTSSAGTTSTLSETPITSNEQWAITAEQDAQDYLGASNALATQAVSDYIAQSPTGLAANEYSLMQAVVGLIGNPPVGTFRLIQATTPPTGTSPPPPPPPTSPPPPPTSPPPPPAGASFEPYVVKRGDTLSGIAASHGETLAQVEKDNPVYLTNPKYDHGDLIFAGDTVMLED